MSRTCSDTNPFDRVYYSDGDFVVRTIAYAPGVYHGAHAHDSVGISLILAGDLEETGPRGTSHNGVCSAVFKPSGLKHANAYGPQGTRIFQIILEGELGKRLPASYQWVEGGPAARVMLACLRLARESEAFTRNDVHRCAVDVVAAIDDEERRTGGSDIDGVVGGVIDRLSGADTVSVSTMAADAGMHPVSLARTFRRQVGCSITEYVRRRRVVRACREIVGGAASLADAAVTAGFADQPHLNRIFKAELGISPGKYRTFAA